MHGWPQISWRRGRCHLDALHPRPRNLPTSTVFRSFTVESSKRDRCPGIRSHLSPSTGLSVPLPPFHVCPYQLPQPSPHSAATVTETASYPVIPGAAMCDSIPHGSHPSRPRHQTDLLTHSSPLRLLLASGCGARRIRPSAQAAQVQLSSVACAQPNIPPFSTCLLAAQLGCLALAGS